MVMNNLVCFYSISYLQLHYIRAILIHFSAKQMPRTLSQNSYFSNKSQSSEPAIDNQHFCMYEAAENDYGIHIMLTIIQMLKENRDRME